jgi:Methyltransferase domain
VPVRTTVYKLLDRIAKTGDAPEPIVEFGAARADSQLHLPPVRSLFPGQSFTGIDMFPGVGVDQLHDLRRLGIRDGSVGTALLLDTIEHVEDPPTAMRELERTLADDGILLLTSHFFFPIHRYPSDYWRFTADGILALLRDFGHAHAGEAGLRLFPHTVVGLGAGTAIGSDRWQRLCIAVDQWLREEADSWKERILSYFPPVIVQNGYELYARRSIRARIPLPKRARHS